MDSMTTATVRKQKMKMEEKKKMIIILDFRF